MPSEPMRNVASIVTLFGPSPQCNPSGGAMFAPVVRALMRVPTLLLLASTHAFGAGTHCLPHESVAFSCSLAVSKVVSVCFAKASNAKPATLFYRFGRLGAPELVFPESPAGSLQRFRYAHYFRYQVDRTELNFSNAGVEYSVFDDYDGEERPKYARGVRVTANGKEHELLCKRDVASHLKELAALVPCDAESGLTLDGCK
ncbi:hypothetical protein [Simplicispira suum]|nr:hypothetical protein [Simplicispira suum]